MKTANFYNTLIHDNNVAELTFFMNLLPKGGDIHHHYSGSIYAETYLDWVEKENLFIDCNFHVASPKKEGSSCKLLSVSDIKKQPHLYNQLIDTWSDRNYLNHFHNQPPPDEKFFGTFSYFVPTAQKNMRAGLKLIKQRAIEEHVSYIETMPLRPNVYADDFFSKNQINLLNKNLSAGKTQTEVDKVLHAIDSTYSNNKHFLQRIEDFKKLLDSVHANIDDEEFTMRFQTYALRVENPLDVFTSLFASFLVAEQSELVVGVNIVGPENADVALEHYSLHMNMFHYLKTKFPKVKKALHAGELTLGLVEPEDLLFHISEAVNIAGAQRIGHGIDLPFESNSIQLLKTLKSKSIPIEINLTSNEFILGVKDARHPYLIYKNFDVPMVISTDDSGVSRNNLTDEYIKLAIRYKPSYNEIKRYVYNSIHYSFLDDRNKKIIKGKLDDQFKEFEQLISDL